MTRTNREAYTIFFSPVRFWRSLAGLAGTILRDIAFPILHCCALRSPPWSVPSAAALWLGWNLYLEESGRCDSSPWSLARPLPGWVGICIWGSLAGAIPRDTSQPTLHCCALGSSPWSLAQDTRHLKTTYAGQLGWNLYLEDTWVQRGAMFSGLRLRGVHVILEGRKVM